LWVLGGHGESPVPDGSRITAIDGESPGAWDSSHFWAWLLEHQRDITLTIQDGPDTLEVVLPFQPDCE